MATAFELARIERMKTRIESYEDALTNILLEDVASYSFDDGQTKQTVTKRDVEKMERMITRLLNQLVQYEINVGVRNAGTILTPGY